VQIFKSTSRVHCWSKWIDCSRMMWQRWSKLFKMDLNFIQDETNFFQHVSEKITDNFMTLELNYHKIGTFKFEVRSFF